MAKRLTKKQEGFVKDFMETGNGTKAALKNYDTDDENIAAAIASQNLRRQRIVEYLDTHAEAAESKIFELSQKAKSEMVSLIASKDIMDRAGYKPVEKTVNLNINQEETPELIEKAKQFNEWFKKQQTSKT